MIRILLVIFFIVCSCSETKVIELNNDIGLDCIRQAPIETEKTELYDLKPVKLTNLFPPFTKKLQVCGITLVARDDVSNSFMENIGKTVKEIFIINHFTDTAKQQELLIQLFKYKTLIPLFYGEDWSLNFEEENQFDLLTKQNSMCDIIMEGVDNQTMEERKNNEKIFNDNVYDISNQFQNMKDTLDISGQHTLLYTNLKTIGIQVDKLNAIMDYIGSYMKHYLTHLMMKNANQCLKLKDNCDKNNTHYKKAIQLRDILNTYYGGNNL